MKVEFVLSRFTVESSIPRELETEFGYLDQKATKSLGISLIKTEIR